jgi:uncharacterized protein with HEPN domain
MNPDPFKFVGDILDSIKMIQSYLSGIKSFSEYTSNSMLIDAAELRLSIIGEAMWKISKLNPTVKVTDQKKIIGLRHILVHDDDLIDDASIWKIVHKNLNTLKEELEKFLV